MNLKPGQIWQTENGETRTIVRVNGPEVAFRQGNRKKIHQSWRWDFESALKRARAKEIT